MVVEELTLEQGRIMLDGECRKVLGISLAHFLGLLVTGRFDGSDDCEIQHLVMSLPFAGVRYEKGSLIRQF